MRSKETVSHLGQHSHLNTTHNHGQSSTDVLGLSEVHSRFKYQNKFRKWIQKDTFQIVVATHWSRQIFSVFKFSPRCKLFLMFPCIIPINTTTERYTAICNPSTLTTLVTFPSSRTQNSLKMSMFTEGHNLLLPLIFWMCKNTFLLFIG